ncbi:hypothetical protein FHS82_000853 [Pseudochelatococcus lubricantis]|uniref:Uncharacterized protein n=1 Tax=Pseudochelatococcus lubricantis TaxID=1538102 RepID=A0ABX0UW92_9HYPH|nr:hypothetical protein [Pseudochelatococcus lubricantis]NIJ57027.1 hypothetical protein [Pseudochelatococcus lubricantis]
MSVETTLPQLFRGWTGWTADEFAALRHACEALENTGADTDVGWGLSDEGDAWFAICEEFTGEPILHVIRTGRTYTAIAPALGKALHAGELRMLVAEAVARLECLPTPPAARAGNGAAHADSRPAQTSGADLYRQKK